MTSTKVAWVWFQQQCCGLSLLVLYKGYMTSWCPNPPQKRNYNLKYQNFCLTLFFEFGYWANYIVPYKSYWTIAKINDLKIRFFILSWKNVLWSISKAFEFNIILFRNTMKNFILWSVDWNYYWLSVQRFVFSIFSGPC